MTSKNRTTGLEIKSIVYTIQREGGSVHRVQVDPVDYAMVCSCDAGRFSRLCWAQKMVRAGQAPKPVIRVKQRPRRVVVSAEARDWLSQLDV